MEETEQNSSTPETQRDSGETLQRSTPNEDAASQREKAGDVTDPEKKRLHEEAASHRKRAKDLEAQLKVYKEAEEQAKLAQLSESEKAQKRAEAAEAQSKHYKQQLIDVQVKLAAKDKGIIDPDMAIWGLHQLKLLEYDDDDMPTNLDKALDDLIKHKPFLVPPKPAEPPATPAQTAQPQRPNAPGLPPMTPERTKIVHAGTPPPGTVRQWGELLKP